ncbi:hypothetical protein FHX34_106161 [Actinoplanes teichomyceticus]|uniref:Uncharacterized protein n=1 Tax=Actinoplanes teichomyceticus TaxID=1867 RepID=A0A561VII7_ACTTI|nr:hypothetical protein FHX34_106161 [Actinoplanes teichomyceticus]
MPKPAMPWRGATGGFGGADRYDEAGAAPRDICDISLGAAGADQYPP